MKWKTHATSGDAQSLRQGLRADVKDGVKATEPVKIPNPRGVA